MDKAKNKTPLYILWFVEADMIHNVRFERMSYKGDKFVIWYFFYCHLHLLKTDSDLKYIICSELYVSLTLHLSARLWLHWKRLFR
jgi:hypothetical protein